MHKIPGLLSGLALLAVLPGCPDTTGYYADYQARYEIINPSSSSGAGGACSAGPPAVGEVDGPYLFVLATSLYPPTPIVFEADMITSEGADGFEFTMTLQPLASGPSGPNDRVTPIGDPFSLEGPYPVAADGSFTAELPLLNVPGPANPISGNPIAAAVTLTGTFCAPGEFVCGVANGVTVEPPDIDIDGSTFTIERLDAPGPPYPEPPQIDCAGALAQPI
ncbi:MAG: hypothetical protein DRI90_28775 [Deltaproteobacteria bacterium]|nr:MAG: hypothetical protein DRI90_28775 [Deltaproteobacteria bacterium]